MSLRKSLSNLTLQKRFSLFVAIGLLAGLGLFSWLALQSLSKSTDRILEERLSIARLMASHLDETLAYIWRDMGDVDLSGGPASREEFASAVQPLKRTLANSEIVVRGLFFSGTDGFVRFTEPDMPEVNGTLITNHPEVNEVRVTGKPTVSGVISLPGLDEPVVLATSPVLDETGRLAGLLTSALDVPASANNAFRPVTTIGKTGYDEIVDGNGIVIVRNEPGIPPSPMERSDHPGKFAELIRKQEETVGTCHRCHETQGSVKRHRDVLAFVPLSNTSWGVAIRQSEEEALAPTRQLERELLLAGAVLLVGISVFIWIMMSGIVRPIKSLTSAAKRVAGGDFKTLIPVQRRDEIGELGDAFYKMTRELASSRDILVMRNEELSAINSIAVTVSRSLNLEEVLRAALEKVLEITRTKAGWVMLRARDNGNLEMMSIIAPEGALECPEFGNPEADCACHRVLHNGQITIVNDSSQCCLLGKEDLFTEDFSGIACIPLRSKQNKVLGLMNIVCGEDRLFTEHDFTILDSIGYHIGLTIENSILYEETKQKELLRGQLLHSVINAQEEERKRIARELHDEFGQLLAGMIMSIESLENIVPKGQPKFLKKLEATKSMILHAMDDTRRLTLGLRPSTLDDLGLVTTVRAYAESVIEETGMNVDFACTGLKKRLAPTIETALFRIIQEGMNNIIKHAEADNVSIRLDVESGDISVVIEDDGKGFNVDSVFRSKVGVKSLGLLGIQERVTLLGGTFDIESEPGKGTRITVKIPAAAIPGELVLQ